jgi:2-polyprenyl-3-methyl-5-hydroxy-6-metoxy-1,4-benzoquinol methylase
MNEGHLQYLACPNCSHELILAKIDEWTKKSIKSGLLQCIRCSTTYDIVDHVPRFVSVQNYAAGFGYQWSKHAITQYDSYTGAKISEKRFFDETEWSRDLRGETILEVGSGAGRFTEQAARTGAMVVSMDYSRAVHANYHSNGWRDNVLIVQGDIYAMPFRRDYFDKVVCIGVLQHTPDVRKSFFSLTNYLSPGGSLVIDVYGLRWWTYLLVTQRWIRPLTKRLASETLYSLVVNWVNFVWPVARVLSRLPKSRYIIRNILLISQYQGILPLNDKLQKEWAILDTFDVLSPAYDKPQTLRTVQMWFEQAGLKDVHVHYGHNGIVGRGIRAP